MRATRYRDLGPALRRAGASLVYSTTRERHWWVNGEHAIYPLSMSDYCDGVWRITLLRSNVGLSVNPAIYSRITADIPTSIEGSFVPSELDQVAAWIVEHLERPVESVPDWLSDRYPIATGQKLRAYFWSKDAYKIIEPRRSVHRSGL